VTVKPNALLKIFKIYSINGNELCVINGLINISFHNKWVISH